MYYIYFHMLYFQHTCTHDHVFIFEHNTQKASNQRKNPNKQKKEKAIGKNTT